METVYKLINNKTWKSLYFDNERVYLSSKAFDDADAFVRHFPEKGLMQPNKDSFPIKRIRGMEYYEGNNSLIVKDADDKREFEFIDATTMQEFVSFIKDQRGFVSAQVPQNKLAAFVPSIMGMLGAIILGIYLYHDAAIIEAGQEVEISGKGKLFQLLVSKISGLIGTKGAIVVGIVGVGYYLYAIYTRIKNPVQIYKTVWARHK